MNSFDLDGVITVGIRPSADDVIITGRSFEEEPETTAYLNSIGVRNKVYYNPEVFDKKTRVSSGYHKAATLLQLGIRRHFEDDPVQAEVIRQNTNCYVVMIQHDLTELENVRHRDWR